VREPPGGAYTAAVVTLQKLSGSIVVTEALRVIGCCRPSTAR